MVKYKLIALLAAVASATSAAFVSPALPPIHSNFALSSTRSSTSTSTSRAKKSVRERTSEEAVSLIRDVVQAAFDAGPRAAPSRTLQAYIAISRTLQDFSPIQRPGRQAEEFSAPVALRKLFERLGATYIKLGQFVASSPSLFPKEYVLEFQKCLDSTEPIDWKIVKSIIEKETGPINNNFAFIDETPLASASIAQVHAAKLKTGEEVVIKVQKPQIDNLLKADLNFIYIASRVLEFLQPDFERTSLSAVAGDVKSSMLEELDFEKEAENIEEFREFLRDQGLRDSVTAPRVYRDQTTKKVLTMERLRGVSMVDAESIRTITNDPESLIITALNTWTTSVMNMPWFHADVHSGNLLVLDDGRVGFIDFGMVGRVGEKTFNAVSELSTSMALGDYEGMAKALLNMGATDEDVDVQKFGRDIEQVMNDMAKVSPDTMSVGVSGDGTVQAAISFDENEVTDMLLKIVDVTEDNGLKLPREFGLLVKQSLYFDRYLKILAPDLNTSTDARMVALQAADSKVEVIV
ncbi:ABC1 kinase family protein [Skeletonema marinoi]|uniref:ABC1 kinase family protein n=1 Tax=Skeletonema marinoi TaxID=267567 RepID=A0AAD8Y640_9STRA|nr:ABC1 kinase family protein [Skeletonema marinoi]